VSTLFCERPGLAFHLFQQSPIADLDTQHDSEAINSAYPWDRNN